MRQTLQHRKEPLSKEKPTPSKGKKAKIKPSFFVEELTWDWSSSFVKIDGYRRMVKPTQFKWSSIFRKGFATEAQARQSFESSCKKVDGFYVYGVRIIDTNQNILECLVSPTVDQSKIIK